MRRPGIGLGFELGISFNAAGESGGMGFSTSFSDINLGLFGTDTTQTGTGTGTEARTETSELTSVEKVDVDEAGILKMIEDILKGTGGLAEIFGAEQGAGLFGTSAAKQGTEDLLAKIAGEIAKVTATRTATQAGEREVEAETASETRQEAESPGLLSNIFGGLGSLF